MPIFTAIGTAIAGALFAGSSLAATLISGALAFGTKIALSYLNRPKKRNYSAVQGETQFGGDVPVSTLYGIGKVRGQRLYYAKYGSGNKYNAEVFVLANGWCDGLEPYVYFYGEKHDLVEREIIENEVAHYGVDGFDDLISIRFYDGRPGQGVDTKLVSDTADLGQPWKETSCCTGLTYVVVEREYDSAKFEKGRPDFDFVLRGLREYDPREDSTVAGGSGDQRLDDPSTWVFTKNPAVHRLNYQLGLRGLVSGRTLIGEGKTLGQLDLGTYFAAMNVCDTLRDDGKPIYECALFVSSDDDHTEVLREFDDAMAGYAVNRRGLSGVIPGAPQIPVLEITADDIPIERAQEIQRRKSAFDLYNHLAGQFTSIDSQWSPESLKPIYVNADVAADGRARQTTNDFLQVTDPDIAQYLLTIRYRQNRLGGSATIPVSWRVGLAVQEGEWVTFEGTDWLVTGWRCDENFRFTLTLAETSSDVYDDEEIEPGPIIIPSTPPINPSLLSNVQNFNIEVGSVQGANGYEVPALRFTWDPPEDPTITAVRFFYFRGNNPTGATVYEVRSEDPERGELVTSKDVAPGDVYTGRCTIVTVPDRFKTYSSWKTTAIITGGSFYPIDLDQLQADVKELMAWTASGYRDVMDELLMVTTWAANQELANFADKQQLRRELRSESDGLYGTVTAEYTEAITVATGPNSALAHRITSLEATIPNLASLSAFEALALRVEETEEGVEANAADIISLNGAIGDKADASAVSALSLTVAEHGSTLTSQADAITALQTSIGEVSASATFRMNTGYTPAAGWTSRIGLQTRINSSGTFRDAGLFLESTASEARILLDADQVGILAGGSVAALFDAGTAYIQTARIRNLDATNITASKLDAVEILQNGTVLSTLIEQHATADVRSQYNASEVTLGPTGSFTEMASVSITAKKAGRIAVKFFAYVNQNTVNPQLVYELRRGATVIQSGNWPKYVDTTAGLVFVGESEAVSAGTYTYSLYARNSSTANGYCSRRYLEASFAG
jgi:hypothetical protein